MNKNSLIYQIKLIAIVFSTILFLAFLWFSAVYGISEYNKSITNTRVDEQTRAVERAAKLNVDVNDPEQLSKVLDVLRYNDAAYPMVYYNNTVIYENNDTLTEKFKGNTIRKAYGVYSYEGGEHLLEIVEKMEEHKSGSDYFIKVYNEGRHYISWVTVKNYNNYIIYAAATPQSYIYGLYNFIFFKYVVYTLCSVYSVILIAFCLFLCFSIYHRRIQNSKFMNERFVLNDSITRLNKKLNITERKFEDLTIRDILTGVYNRKFFDVFLQKVDVKMFEPISIIMFDINGLGNINLKYSYEKGDEILAGIANICKSFLTEKDVVARYGNGEFVVLMVNTSREEAFQYIKNVETRTNELYFDDYEVSLSYGVGTKNDSNETIIELLEQTEDSMKIDKLSSKDSVHSDTVNILKTILYEKTTETSGHCDRLKKYAMMIANDLGFDDKKAEEISLLAYLHDIGKIIIPDYILNKNGPLTQEEATIMRTHPELGYGIAMSTYSLKPVAKFIMQHHEQWDGNGYPLGIKGEEISQEARIISIVDAFDAMISKRVYKDKIPIEDALNELMRCAGTQFDPDLSARFVRLVRQNYEV